MNHKSNINIILKNSLKVICINALSGLILFGHAQAQSRIKASANAGLSSNEEVAGGVGGGSAGFNSGQMAANRAFAQMSAALSPIPSGGNLHIDYEVDCVDWNGQHHYQTIPVDYPDLTTLKDKLCGAGDIVSHMGDNNGLTCTLTALSDNLYGYPYDVARQVYGCEAVE